MKLKSKTRLNWNAIIKHFGMNKKYIANDPDMITHEIAHILDCTNSARIAFGKIGDQTSVNNIVKKYCHSAMEQDHNEIASTAISYLVCEHFGQTNLRAVLDSMIGNLSSHWFGMSDVNLILNVTDLQGKSEEGKQKAYMKFCMYLQDKDIKKKSKSIIRFLSKFKIEEK